jgi:hypothetical protein
MGYPDHYSRLPLAKDVPWAAPVGSTETGTARADPLAVVVVAGTPGWHAHAQAADAGDNRGRPHDDLLETLLSDMWSQRGPSNRVERTLRDGIVVRRVDDVHGNVVIYMYGSSVRRSIDCANGGWNRVQVWVCHLLVGTTVPSLGTARSYETGPP